VIGYLLCIVSRDWLFTGPNPSGGDCVVYSETEFPVQKMEQEFPRQWPFELWSEVSSSQSWLVACLYFIHFEFVDDWNWFAIQI